MGDLDMTIGILKEIMHDENRVAATPDTCARYLGQGHRVLVQTGAGEGALFNDGQYAAAGAEIVAQAKDVFQRADLILKVKEPLMDPQTGVHEADRLREGQVLITFIHPAAPSNHAMVKRLAQRGVIALTLDGVPRISRAQNMDALTSMSTCAGYKGVLMGCNLLPRFVPQIFSAVGMIKPISALVVGVGVAGLQALATAKRLGARIFAADIRPAAREQAQSLGAQIVELKVPDSAAVGEGGYARALSHELLEIERAALRERLPDMDLLFLSALVPGKLAPVLVTEEARRCHRGHLHRPGRQLLPDPPGRDLPEASGPPGRDQEHPRPASGERHQHVRDEHVQPGQLPGAQREHRAGPGRRDRPGHPHHLWR